MSLLDRFIKESEDKAFDPTQRRNGLQAEVQVNRNMQLLKGVYANPELARNRAAFIRRKTIDHLDSYLIEFESQFTKRGGKIIWAQTYQDAGAELAKLVLKKNVQSVFLKESDLSTEVMAEVALNREKVTIFGNEPYQLAITDCRFMMADTGSLAYCPSDAREKRILHQAQTLVLLSSIDRLLPSVNDLELFTSLLTMYSSGVRYPDSVQVVSGPKQPQEPSGTTEVILLLIDNGRTQLLAQPEQRYALSCIHCGACSAVCPVTQTIGTRTYESTYSGPIGSVMMPYVALDDDYHHLSYASTLCGKCNEVCPVKLDIPRMLSFNRQDFVTKGIHSKKENIAIYFWKKAMLKRTVMEKGGQKLKSFMLKQFFKKDWGERRTFPEVATKSFNTQWCERKGIR